MNHLVLSHKDISDGIDFWKVILGEHGFQPGSKLGPLLSLCDVNYLALLFAGLELGGSVCVVDKAHTVETASNVRARVLAPIDIVIVDPNTDALIQATGDFLSDKILLSSMWHNYVAKDFSFSNIREDSLDNVALYATSSGTSGTPKVISYSHKFLYDIAQRCIKDMDFKEDDKIMHLSNIHHGGSAGLFFIPTLMASKNHYFEYGLNPNSLKKIIDIVLQEKINKIMFPNSILLEKFIMNLPKVDHKLDLFTLQSKSKTWLPYIKRANINSVYSVFGSTETVGPLFKNVFTKDDDPATFNVLNYGKPLDDFFNIKQLSSTELEVTVQNADTYILNDAFVIDTNGDYVFSGRKDLFRVNEVELTIPLLDNIVANHFKTEKCILIPDPTCNKIYMLCEPNGNNELFESRKQSIENELNQISPNLTIDFVLFAPIEKFIDQIKFNYSAARLHFQKTFDLI
jgi:acyl-coenzyme A synthetase/AMP-(fatty) acid ligase